MKKILVPIDFSPLSLSALDYAVNIAEKSKSKITVLHVLPRPILYMAAPEMGPYTFNYLEQEPVLAKQRKNAYDSMETLKLWPKYVNSKLITKLVVGNNIYKEIIEYAEKNKFDIIVTGSKGPASFGKSIIGTNAERILRFTAIPVLAIKETRIRINFNNIIFASTFDSEAKIVYPFVSEIAKLYSSKVHLLRINTRDNFMQTEQIFSKIENFRLKFKGNFKPAIRADFQVEDGIVKYAKAKKAGLIAIGVRRRKGPSRYLASRIVEEVIRKSNIPVLAIDNPR